MARACAAWLWGRCAVEGAHAGAVRHGGLTHAVRMMVLHVNYTLQTVQLLCQSG